MIGIGTVVVVLEILGLGVIASLAAAAAATFYRARFREPLPEAASLIIGLGTIAIILNTRLVFVQFVSDDAELLALDAAARNLATFFVGAVGTFVGHAMGERFGQSSWLSIGRLQPSFNPIVRAAGRHISLTLPDEIEDIEGFDPVSDEVKRTLSGMTLDFPRGLTVEALEEQLSTRLTDKHDIGYVDVDVEPDGAVTYLAVGQRPAGLGPTLPPGSVAIAIRADPAFSAGPGDAVEIWTPGREPEPVGAAELRAAVGDIATIVCDASLADRIDPNTSYRLVTLPSDARPDREFAASLRNSPETLGVVDVSAESQLVDRAIADLEVTVIAIGRETSTLTLPAPGETVHGGDRLFVLARPGRLRTLEAMEGVRSVPASELEGGPDLHGGLRPWKRRPGV